MQAQEVIESMLGSTQHMLTMFVNDLSDADFLARPTPGANHIAWQLGHLIISEQALAKDALPGVKYPGLPSGFAEQYTTATATVDPPKGFKTKAEYLDLFDKTRKATIAATAKLTEADLDQPTKGKVAQYAPTLGHLLVMVANHTMMHAGQFSVVRRKLGKPHVM